LLLPTSLWVSEFLTANLVPFVSEFPEKSMGV
jgi:hypothetical protein